MFEDDFDEFVSLLDDAYVFQKERLSAPAKVVFFRAMAGYPLTAVRAAMSAHLLDPKVGKYAMQPADLNAQIIAASGGDGRPGAEEAWAIALTSRDEADTVVWTQEAAEAFAGCQPILDMGDEVGARMAFKEIYLRLVGVARLSGSKAIWSASIGWDAAKRTAVLTRAASAGLLSAPQVAGLLPPPEDEANQDSNARHQIDKIKTMMLQMSHEKARESEAYSERERQRTYAAKAHMNYLAANHKRDEAA